MSTEITTVCLRRQARLNPTHMFERWRGLEIAEVLDEFGRQVTKKVNAILLILELNTEFSTYSKQHTYKTIGRKFQKYRDVTQNEFGALALHIGIKKAPSGKMIIIIKETNANHALSAWLRRED